MGCFHVMKKGRVASGGLVDSMDKEQLMKGPRELCTRKLLVIRHGSEPAGQAAALPTLSVSIWPRLE